MLHFSEEPQTNKEYTFIRPFQSEPFEMKITFIDIIKSKGIRYGIFLSGGEKRKIELDWHGWYA